MGVLGQKDKDILEFERSWWKHAGGKEHAIREHFNLSATRYYQLLNELLEKPEAEAHDPILVKRLKRLRAYRQKQRVARLLGSNYSPGRG
ncbi:MAG: DUF3263 domain-containing protein [Actinobacteria bacterium]|nr:DUF3263 domain-containing protein [Actinomycetota bacterium]MDQ3532419.1 DUF3263 domain-containing protein [Actinomycetota bacterium]